MRGTGQADGFDHHLWCDLAAFRVYVDPIDFDEAIEAVDSLRRGHLHVEDLNCLEDPCGFQCSCD